MTNRTTRFRRPPRLPADAIGFLTTRQDRPERLALYRPDGTISNTFGYDDTPAGIADAAQLRLEPVAGKTRMWAVYRDGSL